MISSIRTALVVLATLSASSVAPAKVGPSAEPLIATTSAAVPSLVTPVPFELPPAAEAPAEQPAATQEAEEAVAEPEPVKPTGDLKSLVAQLRSSEPGSRELECLAVGVYYESKGEPLIGQLAVAEVIANRAKSGRFASTYCGVLFQRGQFSFIRGKKLPSPPRASAQWKTAVAIAKIADQDLKDSAANKALFFHATRVRPGWKLKRVATIGNHIFYR